MLDDRGAPHPLSNPGPRQLLGPKALSVVVTASALSLSEADVHASARFTALRVRP